VGRGAASTADMTGGTACEASMWKSNSGVECKLSGGGRGGRADAAGAGAACGCDVSGLQAAAGTQALELRRLLVCELCWRG